MIRTASAYDRIGAYGVIASGAGRVLLIETNGRLYLPGGRLEAGETTQEALERELEEECGWKCRVLPALGQRLQPVFEGRSTLLAHYHRADLIQRTREGDHRSFWLDAGEAAQKVHRDGDRWAILQAKARFTPAITFGRHLTAAQKSAATQPA